jgi:hypothetical protein
MSDAQLIERYIETDPWHPGRDDVRLIAYAVPVWALVGHYLAVGENPEQVAIDYDLPLEAVLAALAYYRQHKELITARMEANIA